MPRFWIKLSCSNNAARRVPTFPAEQSGGRTRDKKICNSFCISLTYSYLCSMNKYIVIAAVVAMLAATSCEQKKDDGAATMLAEIEQLYEQGNYNAALDSIKLLRVRYPKAIAERQRALRIWQEASLKAAQQDIALTDSALQAVTAQMQAETRIYERNMLGVKKDSLQVRYEALIGEVRIIRKRMEESPQNRE